MQTTAKTSLVLNGFSSLKPLVELLKQNRQTGLYQQSAVLWLMQRAGAQEDFSQLGRKLVALAEHAYSLRQMDTVEQISQMLLNLPLAEEYGKIAHHLQALCLFQSGQLTAARAMFESNMEAAPLKLRARAMLSIAATFYYSGDFHSALPIYVEASRAAASNWCDLFTVTHAQRSIAIIKSIDGDHPGALAHLENMLPIVRAAGLSHPYVYYEHLNSLAVELMEVGRFAEAGSAAGRALASPYASAYPEWRETREEIRLRGCRASRSLVTVNQMTAPPLAFPDNLVRLPLPERRETEAATRFAPRRSSQRARILSYPDWKRKMVSPSADRLPEVAQPARRLTDREMILRLMQLVSARERTTAELELMLEVVEEIAARQKGKNNLET
jgi:tetratricopeptide (TPR) repeat protein